MEIFRPVACSNTLDWVFPSRILGAARAKKSPPSSTNSQKNMPVRQPSARWTRASVLWCGVWPLRLHWRRGWVLRQELPWFSLKLRKKWDKQASTACRQTTSSSSLKPGWILTRAKMKTETPKEINNSGTFKRRTTFLAFECTANCINGDSK